MAKVKCEYCGNYINDLDPICPVCGARNKDHKRSSDGTPKTIEELKSWYIARNLPPEETTRFFIGKNIKEPKAFGIYEENGIFVVYKNKANGQRAIRYQGTDEAYAVNELYLKLKEEILRQKTINLNKKQSQNNSYSSNNYSRYNYNTNRCSNNKRRKIKNSMSSVWFVYILMIIVIFGGITTVLFKNIETFLPRHYSYYYLDNNNQIYYCQDEDDGDDTWWLYDKDTKEWSVYKILEEDTFPEGIIEDTADSGTISIANKLNLNSRDLDIYYSRNFIDAGNHRKPSSSYYYHNNRLYYYLDDIHSSYGSTDNTGWYVYDDNNWSYYCSTDDKEKLGDDLWYSDRDYNVGTDIKNIYDYNDELSQNWNPTSFEDTSWYQSYESNNNAYQNDIEDKHDDDYNWDNDNDYDWDDDYDWDYGGGDWDSDW